MHHTIAQKYILGQIVEKLCYDECNNNDNWCLTDDIDCTDLACSFIFDGGLPHYGSAFYSMNTILPKDSERLKKLSTEYTQKVSDNTNTGKRSINKAMTYLINPITTHQQQEVVDPIDENDDYDDDDDALSIYSAPPEIVNSYIIGCLCHEIGWICLTMGYNRSMVQRINFSILSDSYRCSDDLQQVIITVQMILLM